jgi:flagellar biosynthesis protein FlhG
MNRAVQVVAVTGGKGGVGKTNIAVNLGLALADRGKRVVLFDADLGLANVDVLLGLKSEYNVSDVLSEKCRLRDVMVKTENGLRIVPASSGLQNMTALSDAEHRALIDAFDDLAEEMDVLIIDTAAGISSTVINFVRAAQEILAVVCNEPSSITDAYALIKLLNRDYDIDRFRIVTNMTRSQQEAQSLYNNLLTVTERFMDVTLHHIGNIPYDETVRKAVRRQKPVWHYAPRSAASLAFCKLAEKVSELPLQKLPGGHLEFFVQTLVQPLPVKHMDQNSEARVPN